jgi:hypothetical protein
MTGVVAGAPSEMTGLVAGAPSGMTVLVAGAPSGMTVLVAGTPQGMTQIGLCPSFFACQSFLRMQESFLFLTAESR